MAKIKLPLIKRFGGERSKLKGFLTKCPLRLYKKERS